MEFIEIILSPLVYVLTLIFDLLASIMPSYPLLVIAVFAGSISLILRPLQKPLRKIENQTTETIKIIEEEFKNGSKNLNSEEKFYFKDELYKKYNYNPFKSFNQAISFFALIPVLISVIILFDNSEFLERASLWSFALNEPDALLYGYNILPVIMFFSTYIDSIFRYKNNPSAKNRFLVISIVLFLLVYSMPSALIIFWISMNLMSMFSFYITQAKE